VGPERILDTMTEETTKEKSFNHRDFINIMDKILKEFPTCDHAAENQAGKEPMEPLALHLPAQEDGFSSKAVELCLEQSSRSQDRETVVSFRIFGWEITFCLPTRFLGFIRRVFKQGRGGLDHKGE
jgi:hypothetical protein